MASKWYMTRDRKSKYGPYDEQQLKEFVQSGRILSTDLLWQEGTEQWVSAVSVAGLFPSTPPPPPVPMAPPHGQPWEHDSGKKIAAGLCGILLGALGIHKFVLGYTTSALIMLLVSILTCGYGAIPMAIVGLIEGILYLTKSDRVFYETYIANKKEWF